MNRVLAVLLLLAAAPGDNVFNQCGRSTTPPPPPPPTNMITPDPDALPQCPQDPPYGCWGHCVGVDMPTFTDQCIDGPGAGSLTVTFEQDVNELIDQALAAGMEVCAVGKTLDNITPCDLGVTPVIDTTEACKPAPPGCHL